MAGVAAGLGEQEADGSHSCVATLGIINLEAFENPGALTTPE